MNASFERVSWFYDPLARLIFGNAIQKSQVTLLRFIPAGASVLLVGGGTGWLLHDLAKLQLPLTITYLELSPRMVAKAKKTLNKISAHLLKVNFIQGKEDDLDARELFDIIFTPFVLDLYPERLAALMMQRLHSHLKLNGFWLVADFYISPHPTNWKKSWNRGLLKAMYIFFTQLCQLQTSTLPPFDHLFQLLPLQLCHTQYFYFGFIRSQVYRRTN